MVSARYAKSVTFALVCFGQYGLIRFVAWFLYLVLIKQ